MVEPHIKKSVSLSSQCTRSFHRTKEDWQEKVGAFGQFPLVFLFDSTLEGSIVCWPVEVSSRAGRQEMQLAPIAGSTALPPSPTFLRWFICILGIVLGVIPLSRSQQRRLLVALSWLEDEG